VPKRSQERKGGVTPRSGAAALTLGALGIVFGDIGTSPLYTMKEAFSGAHHLAPDEGSVYGVLSLVFWAITIIVSVKYLTLIMRADNEGEGGIMALISLVQRTPMSGNMAKYALVALGAFGAALFYGDGMITPAISVLSAVEGLNVAAPGLKDFVIPITVAILIALFSIQRFGTHVIGDAFGPVMTVWFGALAVLGASEVAQEPGVLRALSPHYAVAFFVDQGGAAFLALGSVVLAVTGAEALYADMGHFGRAPIRRAWFIAVLPALLLNYFGQGAMLLSEPGAADSPFFRLVPGWAQIPMVLLATAAAVIASQAVISGAFSVTRQAVQLRFLPLLTIHHTSEEEEGQIYVPFVNWGLLVAIVGLVVGFGSSSALAAAYGISVTGTLAIDTVLFFVVVRTLWGRPLWLVLVGAVAFLVVDLGFFAANLPKVPHGGWFSLTAGVIVFVVLMTWRRGRDILQRKRIELEGPLQEFVTGLREMDDPPVRVPGTAVFLHATGETTPLAMRFNVEINHALHEQVVIFTGETIDQPHVPDDQRIHIDDLLYKDDGIVLVEAKFGFGDSPNVPATLELACKAGLEADVAGAAYFLSRASVLPKRGGDLAMWRKRLFALMNRNAASPVRYFNLPDDRVIVLGGTIPV
jgi:KUP system potassium uptake protein